MEGKIQQFDPTQLDADTAASATPLAAPLEPMKPLGGWHELREVLILSGPIVVTMVSFTVMNMVDAVLLGHHDPTGEELAAFTPVTSILFLIVSFLMGLLSLTNTFSAQTVGAGRKGDAASYVWQSVHLATIWGVLAMVMWPLAPAIFSLSGGEQFADFEHFREMETSFFRYLLIRTPGFGWWLAISAFYQAIRRPMIPMIVAILGNGLNLIGNYALIFGKWGLPEMGINGAGLATAVATYVQAIAMFAVFLSESTHREYNTRGSLAVNISKMWQILRYGLPAGISWVLDHGSWALFFLGIIGHFGVAALGGSTAAFQLYLFSFMPVWGLNVGVQALVGYHVGMRDYRGATRRTHRALFAAMAYMWTLGILMFIFREPLVRLFLSSDVQPELLEEVVKLGSTVIIFTVVFQAFDALTIISYGALTGAGDTKFPMYISVFCGWFLFLPLAFGLSRYTSLGLNGAWLGATINIAIVGLLTLWRFESKHWQRINLLGEHIGHSSPDIEAIK